MESITDLVVKEIKGSNIKVTHIARKSGVAASAIYSWLNKGATPTLENCQWVLAVLGKRLEITENK